MRTFALLISLLIAMPAVAQVNNESGSSFGDNSYRMGRTDSGTTWQESTTPNSGLTMYSDSHGRNCMTTRSGGYATTQCSGGY